MIPLFRPSCSELEVEYVTRVLRSGWWGQGPVTEQLENEFSQRLFQGCGHAVAVNSGTSALELAARAMDIGVGWIVIVPALTFISTALAMQHTGAVVVFADIQEDTLTLDWDDVRRIINDEFGNDDPFQIAVVPVWYGGYVDTIPEDILESCLIIEDCAHAAGSADAGKQGDIAAWSFHAVKNLAAGDGGMITVPYSEPDIMNTLKALRWCGINRSTWERDHKSGYGWDYDVTENGQKAHMNDITAAVALAQLQRLDELNEKRRVLIERYAEKLRYWPSLKFREVYAGSANHLCTIRFHHESRDALIRWMLYHGVSAGVHYKPLYYYDKLEACRRNLPVTHRVWKELVTLPLYPDMTLAEQNKVIKAIHDYPPTWR